MKRWLSICILLIVFVLCLIVDVKGSCADLTFFDEVLVYEPGYGLGTISFAPNGTLFFNSVFNVYKLVNGRAFGVYGVRPENDSREYCGVAVAPNGTLYVSVNDGVYGWIYEVAYGKISKSVYTRYGYIGKITFHPDGELFYTDGESIFSVAEGCLFNKTMFGGDESYTPLYISGISFSPDGTLFACVTYGYWLDDIPLSQYAIIWRVLENELQWVYVRHWRNGIDTIAINPDGEIYFESHGAPAAAGLGGLYKLAPKTQVSLQNSDCFLYSYPIVTNSTVLNYKYNFTSRELKLNLTGPEDTLGVSIITLFAWDFGGKELDFEVKSNGHLLDHTVVKSQDYFVYFTYDHEERVTLTVKAIHINTWFYPILGLGIFLIFAVVVATIIVMLRRKR